MYSTKLIGSFRCADWSSLLKASCLCNMIMLWCACVANNWGTWVRVTKVVEIQDNIFSQNDNANIYVIGSSDGFTMNLWFFLNNFLGAILFCQNNNFHTPLLCFISSLSSSVGRAIDLWLRDWKFELWQYGLWIFIRVVQKFIVEKSRVEKFMVEKSGVERSGVEAWGWKVQGWDVLQPLY